ncbi:hypothetical protein ANN_24723 [Periplaneta americana]|uniref:Uncharacterized protein n=1 Tax=Periplaneta americana TaxID=6978 RepID=A0ABQ8RZE0_PERAM|nr:hypothetical protein ANN_24723 [Periplaneta americana]
MPLKPMKGARAVALVEDGSILRYVVQVLHTTSTTVSGTVQRYRELRSYSRRQDMVGKNQLLAIDDQFLCLQVLRNHCTTAV